MSKAIFSNSDIEFMKNNYRQMSYRDIGNYLGFSERQIRGKLNNMGYTKTRDFNKHYFRCINSDIKAYLLGFIFADGWVVCNPQNGNYELGVQINTEDKYILERLNNELGGSHVISFKPKEAREILGNVCTVNESCVLRIYSKDIVLDLINCGVVENKTYNAKNINIPDEFFFDFLRGLIDGDGCYWKYKNQTYLHITDGNSNILEYLQSVLLAYNIKTSLYQEKEHKFRLYCTDYKSMNILIHKIYHQDYSFCLSRKYEKIKHFLQNGSAI